MIDNDVLHLTLRSLNDARFQVTSPIPVRVYTADDPDLWIASWDECSEHGVGSDADAAVMDLRTEIILSFEMFERDDPQALGAGLIELRDLMLATVSRVPEVTVLTPRPLAARAGPA